MDTLSHLLCHWMTVFIFRGNLCGDWLAIFVTLGCRLSSHHFHILWSFGGQLRGDLVTISTSGVKATGDSFFLLQFISVGTG